MKDCPNGVLRKEVSQWIQHVHAVWVRLGQIRMISIPRKGRVGLQGLHTLVNEDISRLNRVRGHTVAEQMVDIMFTSLTMTEGGITAVHPTIYVRAQMSLSRSKSKKYSHFISAEFPEFTKMGFTPFVSRLKVTGLPLSLRGVSYELVIENTTEFRGEDRIEEVEIVLLGRPEKIEAIVAGAIKHGEAVARAPAAQVESATRG